MRNGLIMRFKTCGIDLQQVFALFHFFDFKMICT